MSLGFIEKAIKIHGDTYDYSLVEYKNMKTKVKIVCKNHGVFEQRADNHLSGKGCSLCKSNKLDTQKFIKRSTEVHVNVYDYSMVNYVHSHEKVNIICKIHGVFSHTANSHLKGHGCPKCAGAGWSCRYGAGRLRGRGCPCRSDRKDRRRASSAGHP